MDKYNSVKNFVLSAGAFALKSQEELTIETKEDGVDLVTSVDKSIEKDFSELVKREFPDHGFYGEEFSELRNDKEYMWCIDPIDGTKFYAKGLPLWCIAISLLHNYQPIYSIIYSPRDNHLYESAKNEGAYLNGKKIKITDEKDISKLTLSWEAPILHELSFNSQKSILDAYSELSLRTYRTRNVGCASLSLAWCAQGFFGGYIKYFSTPKQKLDNLAGILLTLEAGGQVYEKSIDDYILLIGGSEGVISSLRENLKV